MKNFVTFLLGAIVLSSFNLANAELLEAKDYVRLNNIGINLLKSNNINKRLTFNFTSVGHQGVFPVLLDTSRSNDLNLHNNRVVNVYFADYLRISTDAEVAALLAPEIAQGVHSYTGVLNGQFFFTKNGLNFLAKKNELKFDKQAVDYMVNAGYDPKTLVVTYNKVMPEWRGSFWSRHNKTEKRVKEITKYIQTKYPQYL